jgi:hypothetical protein
MSASEPSFWQDAKPFNFDNFSGQLRHRLANHSASIAVMVELTGEVEDIQKLKTSAGRGIAKIGRLCNLLGALGGRQMLPLQDVSLDTFEFDKEIPDDELLWRVIYELVANSAQAGALRGAVRLVDVEGVPGVEWGDDAKPFNSLESFGEVDKNGESGCGLGLAIAAHQLRSKGWVMQARTGSPVKFRIIMHPQVSH